MPIKGRKPKTAPKVAKAAAAAAAAKDDAGARGDRSKRLLDLDHDPSCARARPSPTATSASSSRRTRRSTSTPASRAFERDKADLLDLGVPIRYVTPDEDDAARGRRLRHRPQAASRCPRSGSRPTSVSALVLATSVARAYDAGRRVSQDRRPRAQEARVRFSRSPRHADRVPARVAARRRCSSTSPSEPVRPEAGEIYAIARVREHATTSAVTLTYQTACDRHGHQARGRSVRDGLLARARGWSSGWCHMRQRRALVPRRSHPRGRDGAQAEVARLRA